MSERLPNERCTSDRSARAPAVDRPLLTAQLLLGALGMVGVAAGSSEPMSPVGHGLRVLAAVAVTLLVSRLSVKAVLKLSPFVFTVTLALLVAVLFFGISPAGSESKRWLDLGVFTLQPSEFMKVAVIAYLAAFFYNHLGDWHIWRPMLVIGLAVATVVAEPDLSTGLFIFTLAFTVMIAAGTTITRLLSITLAAAAIATLLAAPYLSQFSYLKDRVIGYADLWGAREQTDTTSYQALQAQEAIARGGVTGIGPGRSTQVPEADTDFISVAIGQALGLIGLATLVAIYLLIAGRGLRIGGRVEGPAALLAAGATAYICGQAGLNLLVASGLAPVTGIPLPGVSHGFNSLLSVAIAFGFLHIAARVAHKQAASAPTAGAGA